MTTISGVTLSLRYSQPTAGYCIAGVEKEGRESDQKVVSSSEGVLEKRLGTVKDRQEREKNER